MGKEKGSFFFLSVCYLLEFSSCSSFALIVDQNQHHLASSVGSFTCLYLLARSLAGALKAAQTRSAYMYTAFNQSRRR